MENSSLNSDSLPSDNLTDKLRCWSLFYIDQDDNIMHDFGWKEDEDAITLAQLLLGIKHTQFILQSLQMAYLENLQNQTEETDKIGQIIEYMESSVESDPDNLDYISPLFSDSEEEG